MLLIGGKEVIRHFSLRFVLWRTGALPWRLARFLDHASVELQILQKAGGGYIFVHRLLLEHFAGDRARRAAIEVAWTLREDALTGARRWA
jgi:hypothetical protein